MTLPRYEVIPSRQWVNARTGQTASVYGSNPARGAADAADWSIRANGWTIRDNVAGTVGLSRPPFATREDADAFAARLTARNDAMRLRAKAAQIAAALDGPDGLEARITSANAKLAKLRAWTVAALDQAAALEARAAKDATP